MLPASIADGLLTDVDDSFEEMDEGETDDETVDGAIR